MLALSIQNEQPASEGTPSPAPQEPHENRGTNDPLIEQELYE